MNYVKIATFNNYRTHQIVAPGLGSEFLITYTSECECSCAENTVSRSVTGNIYRLFRTQKENISVVECIQSCTSENLGRGYNIINFRAGKYLSLLEPMFKIRAPLNKSFNLYRPWLATIDVLEMVTFFVVCANAMKDGKNFSYYSTTI